MGYYTEHTLSVLSGNSDLIKQFREQNESARFALDENGDSLAEIKWYDHEEDLRLFSKKHPNEVFKLEGIGEEQPDMWHEYYKNGLMQKCKAIISYPKFYEHLLQ